jgi:hypothetical protein
MGKSGSRMRTSGSRMGRSGSRMRTSGSGRGNGRSGRGSGVRVRLLGTLDESEGEEEEKREGSCLHGERNKGQTFLTSKC